LYKTVIVTVLYGCETWSLTLRGEHRLRVLENRALRRIFGSKRDDATGEWTKLHNEVGGARGTHLGEKSVGLQATLKTKAWMRGGDQNGS
jgi:hypothetical protein